MSSSVKRPLLSIVIPVYHEQDNIIRVIRGIEKTVNTDYELLIVYDKPEDPTYDVVKQYIDDSHSKCIKLTQNSVDNKRGFMNALRTGFQKANSQAILTMMADMCDDPVSIDKMYHHFLSGSDIVCGSRYMKGGKQIGSPILKRTLSRLSGLSLYYLRRLPVHDPTNNFKIYSKKLLEQIELNSEGGFDIAMQITVKAHKDGYKITEVPTTWRDRTAGQAKFNLKKMAPKYLKWYFYALLPRRIGTK